MVSSFCFLFLFFKHSLLVFSFFCIFLFYLKRCSFCFFSVFVYVIQKMSIFNYPYLANTQSRTFRESILFFAFFLFSSSIDLNKKFYCIGGLIWNHINSEHFITSCLSFNLSFRASFQFSMFICLCFLCTLPHFLFICLSFFLLCPFISRGIKSEI